jgi:hypothetical protein
MALAAPRPNLNNGATLSLPFREQPRDMIDIQSFLWVLRSEEYEEVRAGRPLKQKMVRPENFRPSGSCQSVFDSLFFNELQGLSASPTTL